MKDETIPLETICRQVCELSRTTGQFIKEQVHSISPEKVEVKGLNDFVTYVDKTSEKKLVEGLSKILPEAGFIAEENSSYERKDAYNWIIDPLDGTTNFIHSLPCYAVSIALMYQTEIVVGVVYEINFDECFYAWKDGPAYLNGKEIKVTQAPALKDGLIATGFPYHDFDKMKEYLDLFAYLMQHTHGLRRIGSAATDLAYVACGRFEGFYEYGLKPWDVAAGTLIIQQAGGKVGDFKGGYDYIFGKEIIACNSQIFEEFVEVVKRYFN